MNRQPTREDIQRYIQRWHQLKAQYGDQATNVPEFNQLTKVIRYVQAQAAQRQQQQQQGSLLLSQQPQMPQRNQMQSQSLQIPSNTSMSRQAPTTYNGGNPGPYADSSSQQMLQNFSQSMQQQKQQYMGMGNNVGYSASDAPTPNSSGGYNNNQLAMKTPGSGYSSQPTMPLNVPQRGMTPIGGLNGANSAGSSSGMQPYSAPTPSGNSLHSGSESPFTGPQMQLFKLQTQVAKYFGKSSNGFSPIPSSLLDMAVNERLAVNGYNNSGTGTNPTGAPNTQPSMSSMPQNANTAMKSLSPEQQFQQPRAISGSIRPGSTGNPLGAPSPSAIQPSSAPTPDRPDSIRPQQRSRLSTLKPTAGTPKAGPQESSRGIQAVMYPPEPPIEYDEYVKDKDISDQLVLPVSKPVSQVDTFLLPKVFNTVMQDIPFSGFHAPQSKLRLPSLLPYGVDVNDLMSTREYHISLQIDSRISFLKEKHDKLDDLLPEKEAITIELAMLELLPHQKEVRGSIASQLWYSRLLLLNSHPNFLAKFPDLSLGSVLATEGLYKQQLYSLVQAQNAKHLGMVKEVLETSTRRKERVVSRREKLERFRVKINSVHVQTAKEEQKKIERMAKQRLQALKLNDEEAYLKLLDHTKDKRITLLLNQTNQFLDSLAQAVQTQQRESAKNAVLGTETVEEPEAAAVEEDKKQKIDYYQVAHMIKEEVTKQPDILVGGTLKEYQLKGLQWMVSLFNNHLNGILADEMGLGKTIQTISLLSYLYEVKKVQGPFLVIVPLSTLTNWNIEFDKWCPALKKISFKGTPAERRSMHQDIRLGNFNVVLTTFEYIIRDKALLSRIRWIHMIIDEGHRMKNASSKLSETLTQFYHSDYRLILTGTPLQNNLPELWALLNFVLPKIFNSVKSFDEWFNTPFSNSGGQDKIELSEEETLLVIRRLHKVLRPFLLRRLKRDVEKDLPDKVEKVVKCKMSALQLKLYRTMLKHNAIVAGIDENGKPILIKGVNNQLMQLRKICNHPFVYGEIEQLLHPLIDTNDLIWRIAGKFELLDRILPKFKETGHKVLIFFQMTQIMNIMEDFLHYRGMNYMRLDGGTKSDERTVLLKTFNDPASECFCFLLSTRAGGLGLNLQTADTVIIFDSDWNPHQDLQAQDRAHRIGQKNEVRILRLITEDSIEEMILQRAAAKLEIDGKVIQAGKFDNKSTAEEQEALLRALIEKEEERRMNGTEEEQDLDDDELNQIIARNDEELVVFQRLDQERNQETKSEPWTSRLFSEQELPECYTVDQKSFFKTTEDAIEEYGRGNRERKIAVYDDNLSEEEWLKRIQGVHLDESDEEPHPVVKKKGRPRKIQRIDSVGDDLLLEELAPKRQKTGPGAPRGKRSRAGRPRLKVTANRSTPSVDILSPEERLQLQNNMELIYGSILDYKESARKLSDLFLVKPSKRLYPDYYVLIKHPLAMDVVKKRMNSKAYTYIRDFLEDIHLIFSNARMYNEEGLVVYRDAQTLEQLAVDMYKELYPDVPEDEKAKTLDFSDFDKAHLIRPNPHAKAAQNSETAKVDEPVKAPPQDGSEVNEALRGEIADGPGSSVNDILDAKPTHSGSVDFPTAFNEHSAIDNPSEFQIDNASLPSMDTDMGEPNMADMADMVGPQLNLH